MKKLVDQLKIAFFTIGFGIGFFSPIAANTTIQSTGFPAEQNGLSSTPNTIRNGQTFIATQDGAITSISIKGNDNMGSPANTYASTVNLFLDLDPGDGNIIPSAVYQTFDFTNVTGTNTINLTTPFPVVSGRTYRFEFQIPVVANLRLDANTFAAAPNIDTYTGGVFTGNGTYNTNFDLNFSLTIVSPQNPIPTLSQWGLLIFGLLVINLGIVLIYKQELVLSDKASVGFFYFPFDKAAFGKDFIILLLSIGSMGLIAIFGFGYALMPFDMLGSVLTAALLAYFWQLMRRG